MIRVLFYLVIVGALAFGAVWLADRPGDVVIDWQGRHLETSVMVLLAAVAVIALASVLLWSIIRAIMRSPEKLARHLQNRRGVRGYMAVSRGLIAIGSGDVAAARKFTEEAKRIAPNEPLTLLLRAQTAQLSGDRAGASQTFQQMAGRDDTRLVGLHGLFIEARRRGDQAAAMLHAEEAAQYDQAPAWAGQAALEFRCVAGDWSAALERLERNMKSGLIDKTAYRRQRAVLLTARALAVEETDRDQAKAAVLEAVKLAPTLVPAAALAGRFLTEAGEQRKAGRIIEAAWVWNPHPDLAEGYAHLRPGDSARERLARIEALAAKAPGNMEAALAVARAALDAQEFAIARAALAPLVVGPTRRVAALMAELEERQHGDTGRAREWMTRAMHARRDPAWTADGFVSDHWMPVSPLTGRLDAFEWKDPLAGEDFSRALIEADKSGRVMLDAPAPRAVSTATPLAAESLPAPATRVPDEPAKASTASAPSNVPGNAPSSVSSSVPSSASSDAAVSSDTFFAKKVPQPDPVPAPTTTPVPAAGKPDMSFAVSGKPDVPLGQRERSELAAPPSQEPSSQEKSSQAELGVRRGRGVTPVPVVPALIPLVHAPDDPGPDHDAHVEREPEPTAEALPDSWSRIRQMFRP
jgi:HemY protein